MKVFNDLFGLEKHTSPNMLYSDEVFHSLSGLCQNLCHFSRKNARKVPTTFNEMLLFNASVMGYGASTWMSIVLVQFDVMVTGLLQVSSTMRGVEHVLFVKISSSQPKKHGEDSPFPIMCP